MRRHPPTLVALVATPFFAGCFGTLPTPVADPSLRGETDVRGVVMRGDDGDDGDRVEFSEILEVEWRDASLFLFGVPSGTARSQPAGHEYRYDDISAVLVRQLDVNKTSALIAGGMLAVIATVTFVVTGKSKDGVPVGGGG